MTKGMMKALTSKARPAPQETGCSDLLLRFFESQFFSTWIAIQYLYTSTQPGVHDYLCNKLFELSEASLDSYLLQLVYLAVSKPGGSLERTLVELATRSFRLALKMYWLLLALVQDTPLSERSRLRQLEAFKEQLEHAALDGHYDVPFRNISLDPLSPLMSCHASGVLSPTFAAAADLGSGVSSDAAPGLPALPAPPGAAAAAAAAQLGALGLGVGRDGGASPEQMQRQGSAAKGAGLHIDLKCLHSPEARGLSLEAVVPSPNSNPSPASNSIIQPGASAASQGAGTPPRDRTATSSSSSGGAIMASPFLQRSQQQAQHPGSARNSMEQGLRTPHSASQQHYSRIRQQLGSGEGVTGLLERSKLAGPGGMLVATEDDGPGAAGCFSDDEGQMSGGVLSPTARLRRDTFGATLDFIEALCDASSSLTNISQEERQRALRNGLECINYEIEAAARKNVAIWFPMGAHNERVLRVTAKEAVLLNSRDKAPFMLFVEVLRCPDDKPPAAATSSGSYNSNSYSSTSIAPATGPNLSENDPLAVGAAGVAGEAAARFRTGDVRASPGSEPGPASGAVGSAGGVSLSSISHSFPATAGGAGTEVRAAGADASAASAGPVPQVPPGSVGVPGLGSGLGLGLGLGSSGGIVEAAAAALGHLASGVLQVTGGSTTGSFTTSGGVSTSMVLSASFSQLPSIATHSSTPGLPPMAPTSMAARSGAPAHATAATDTSGSTPDGPSSARSSSSTATAAAPSSAPATAREGGAGAGGMGSGASPFPAGPMIIPQRRQSHADLASLGKDRSSPAASGRLTSQAAAGAGSGSQSCDSQATAVVTVAAAAAAVVAAGHGPGSVPPSALNGANTGSSSSGGIHGQAAFTFPPAGNAGAGSSPGGFSVGGSALIPPPPPSPPPLPPQSMWPPPHRPGADGHDPHQIASPPSNAPWLSIPPPGFASGNPGRETSPSPHTRPSTSSSTLQLSRPASGNATGPGIGAAQGPWGMPSGESALLDELVGSGCLSPPRSDMPRSELQQRMAHALASLRGEAPIVRLHLSILPGADEICSRGSSGRAAGGDGAGTSGRHSHSHSASHHHHHHHHHHHQPSSSSRDTSAQPSHSYHHNSSHSQYLSTGSAGGAAGAAPPPPDSTSPPPTALKAMLSRLGLCARPPDVSGDDPGSPAGTSHSSASSVGGGRWGSQGQPKLLSVRLEVAGGVDLRIVSPHRSHKRTPSVEALSKIATKYKVKSIPPAAEFGPPITPTTPWLDGLDGEEEAEEVLGGKSSGAISSGTSGIMPAYLAQQAQGGQEAGPGVTHTPGRRLGPGGVPASLDPHMPEDWAAQSSCSTSQPMQPQHQRHQHHQQYQQHQGISEQLQPQQATLSAASPSSIREAAAAPSHTTTPAASSSASPGLPGGPGASAGGGAGVMQSTGAMLPRRRMPPGAGTPAAGLGSTESMQLFTATGIAGPSSGPGALPGVGGTPGVPWPPLDPVTERKRREALAVYGERWSQRVKRVQRESPQGRRPGWALRCVVVKNGDDCRQEHLALQLVRTFRDIFIECGLPLWVRHYDVLVTSNRTALIEMIPDSLSIHTIKHRSPPGSTLSDHFFAKFVKGSPECVAAQRKLTESLAAYSIITYLLQIKDRHNGNVLLDDEGHLIHIDFGFMLSNSPGGVNFESAPFKLTRELLEVMDSNSDGKPSELFDYYKVLLIQGFLACRKHSERIVLMVKMMAKSGLPCFKSGAERTVRALEKRLALNLTEVQVVQMVLSLISDSLDAWRTRQYDYYQRVMNGIL